MVFDSMADILTKLAPVAIVRSLGIYELTIGNVTCFPILVLDGAMGECEQYIGGGSTLNESLEIAVDYIEHRTCSWHGVAEWTIQTSHPRAAGGMPAR